MLSYGVTNLLFLLPVYSSLVISRNIEFHATMATSQYYTVLALAAMWFWLPDAAQQADRARARDLFSCKPRHIRDPQCNHLHDGHRHRGAELSAEHRDLRLHVFCGSTGGQRLHKPVLGNGVPAWASGTGAGGAAGLPQRRTAHGHVDDDGHAGGRGGVRLSVRLQGGGAHADDRGDPVPLHGWARNFAKPYLWRVCCCCRWPM